MSPSAITLAKISGNSNNDWVLTHDLVKATAAERGCACRPSFEEVKDKFEEYYNGTETFKGLKHTETLIPPYGYIKYLATRCKMAVVTGRPRSQCMEFLEKEGITDCFDAMVCMEDGPAKPSPFPCARAAESLGLSPAECVMIGDTPDDVVSAVQSGARPVCVPTPENYAKVVAEGGKAQDIDIVKRCVEEGGIVMEPGFGSLLNYFY